MTAALRDGPLEILCGGGEFSSRRNFFSLSNSLYEYFLGLIGMQEFFHLIFPCANIFFGLRLPPPPPP